MKKIFALLTILIGVSGLFAQVSVDPTDIFYKEAQGWELKGYIDPLPLIRPYPANVIREILQKVIDCGNKTDGEVALYEYERIFGKKLNVYVKGAGQYKQSQTQEYNGHSKESSGTKNVKGEGGVAGEVQFHPLVSLGYDMAMYGETADYKDIAPLYVNKEEDSIFDPASIGPINSYLDWNMNVSVGNKNVYMTCGLSKTGYGPFIGNGLALNDTGYHSANLMFSVTRPNWSYASSFQIIGARSNYFDSSSSTISDLSDGKYLSFHVIKYRVNKKVDISYYENILCGPRPNIAYIFPAPYMAIQNIGGASDNLQMGVMLEVKPVKGLVWATDIFVDDLDVNNVVKLNFDSKNRCAGQTGLIYSPENNTCKYISLDYQLVIPYVYSHWEYDEGTNSTISGSQPNYQNYTNSGINIGSTLDPNSDKVSFAATFQPKPFFKLNFTTNFIRHANSAEAFSYSDASNYVLAEPGQYLTDGSCNMHQMFSNSDGSSGKHVKQAWNHLGFMTSDHKMGVLQTGLSGEFTLPKTKHGQFSINAGYIFEYVHNNGVRKNVYKGTYNNGSYNFDSGNDVWTVTTTTSGGVTTTEYVETVGGATTTMTEDDFNAAVKEEVDRQKQAWINNLTDKINHYITIGFKYTY